MARSPKHAAFALAGLLVLSCAGKTPVPPPNTRPRPPGAPPLLVMLVIDQMRADYVDRYGANWKHGLRRLYDGGAYFTNANYPYLNTITCAGHATLSTGNYPNAHGMILNAWWDRGLARRIECTEDAASPLVPFDGRGIPAGLSAPGDSAANLQIPTLTDELRAQLRPAPQVAALSMKARASISLGGHHPDVVAWFENSTWVTGRAFTTTPAPWVARFAGAHPLDAVIATPWAKLLDESAYQYTDAGLGEAPPRGWTATFPHELRPPPTVLPAFRYGRWAGSPMADAYLSDMAIAALETMQLGKGEGVDYLGLSFSILDVVGHPFGPRSHEVQDVLARLDVSLGHLLDALDRIVGKDKYLLALSADHGVATMPEQAQAEKVDAGRVSLQEVWKRVDAATVKALGPGKQVINVEYTDIYLADWMFEKLRAKPESLAEVVAAARSVPGVADAFTRDDLKAPTMPARQAAALSYFPGRSGDIIIVPKPNYIPTTTGTTHGTLYDYDRHVPIILYGAGVKPGHYDRPVSPADVAPTLSHAVGVTMPQAVGKPLSEAFAP